MGGIHISRREKAQIRRTQMNTVFRAVLDVVVTERLNHKDAIGVAGDSIVLDACAVPHAIIVVRDQVAFNRHLGFIRRFHSIIVVGNRILFNSRDVATRGVTPLGLIVTYHDACGFAAGYCVSDDCYV